MQGLVNTIADLRGAIAAAGRVNMVIKTGKVDESLARGLELDNSIEALKNGNGQTNGSAVSTSKGEVVTMSPKNQQKPTRSLKDLAWSGDVCLEGESHVT
jgi:hypothetical protein